MINFNKPDLHQYLQSIQWEEKLPKYKQLKEYIKNGIEQGEIYGMLPSTRVMATILQVNRNTVLKVLDILVWEGWLNSNPKQGYDVATNNNAQRKDNAKFKLPYHLPKYFLHQAKSKSKQAVSNSYISFTKKYALGRINEIKEIDVYNYLTEKMGWTNQYNQLTFLRNQFDCNYILSRILLEDNDAIILSNATKHKLINHIPNLDLRIINLPVIDHDVDIVKIKEIFKKNNNIKYLYFDQTTDLIKWNATSIINIMELCYRHGVIIIENLNFPQKGKSKMLSFKKYDYKHYVITVFNDSSYYDYSLSLIICHPTIIERINQFKQNMDIEMHPILLQFHLHELLLKNH